MFCSYLLDAGMEEVYQVMAGFGFEDVTGFYGSLVVDEDGYWCDDVCFL